MNVQPVQQVFFSLSKFEGNRSVKAELRPKEEAMGVVLVLLMPFFSLFTLVPLLCFYCISATTKKHKTKVNCYACYLTYNIFSLIKKRCSIPVTIKEEIFVKYALSVVNKSQSKQEVYKMLKTKYLQAQKCIFPFSILFPSRTANFSTVIKFAFGSLVVEFLFLICVQKNISMKIFVTCNKLLTSLTVL